MKPGSRGTSLKQIIFSASLTVVLLIHHRHFQQNNRKVAAALAFELLFLTTKGYLDIDQPEPFADIAVRKTDLFERHFSEAATAAH
jgi:chromatin segregation and condensation protein Rec8/ScpA/Scc1 (kleisin family)